MKRFKLCLLLTFLPVSVHAQMPEGAGMQMMEKMQEFAQCMQGVDQKKLEAMGRESEKMEKEVDALCAKGKKAEATAKVASFGKKAMNDPEVKKVQKCTEIMKGIDIPMPIPKIAKKEEHASRKNVCDK